MEQYYEEDNEKKRQMILKESDKKERELSPGLGKIVGLAKKSGIAIIHPEANYHLADGKLVFFEIGGLDIKQAVDALSANQEAHQNSLMRLSLIYSLLLKSWAHGPPYGSNGYFAKEGEEFRDIEIAKLLSIVYGCLACTPGTLIDVENGAIKGGLYHFETISKCNFKQLNMDPEDIKIEHICKIDPEMLELIVQQR